MERWNPDDSIGFLIHEIAHLLGKVYDKRTSMFGLTRAQWFALAHLRRQPGLSQSELAALLDIEDPTVARLLDRMERGGWVTRRRDQTDRRKRRVHVTDKFDEMLRKMETVVEGTRRELLGGLSEEEREDFLKNLHLMKSNVLNMLAQPEGVEASPRRTVRTRSAGPAAE